MTPDRLDDVLKNLPTVSFSEGEYVFGPNTTTGRMVRIESGHLHQKIPGTNGHSSVLHVLKSGQYAGLLHCHTQEPDKIVTEASSEAVLRKIEDPQFRELKQNHSEWFLRRQTELHERMLVFWDLYHTKVRHNLMTLLVCKLCRLCMRFGENVEEGFRINLDLKHQDLANMIGCRLATISRRISKLKEENLLVQKDGNFIFPDRSSLLKKSDRLCKNCSSLQFMS